MTGLRVGLGILKDRGILIFLMRFRVAGLGFRGANP